MQTASVNKRKIEIPQTWGEVKQNRKLYLFAISLFFKGLTETEIQRAFGLRVLKIGEIKQHRIVNLFEKHTNSTNADDVAESLVRADEAFQFITEKQPEVRDNLFEHVFRFRKLHAPKSVLAKTGIWEYALAENAFFSFAESQDVKNLDTLIAIIYREKRLFSGIKKRLPNFNGDIRIEFNDNTFTNREKRISKLPFVAKWMIYRWFAHEREQIIKTFPHVFKQKKEDSAGDGGTWADTIIALSIVGDEDKTANTKMALVLARINQSNKEAEEMKRKMKQQND